MKKRTLIIGGVAGGATAAARLRRRDEDREIIIFEKGEYISYANCGLPYYIGDAIKSREALLLQTPEGMKSKYNIDVRVSNEVTAILPEERKLVIEELNTGRKYEEKYDELIIATGSSPIKPPIKGIDSENIFTLWTVPDTDRIKAYIKENKPRSAAVIGGGFIGLEMAENLHEAGLQVTLIEMQDQVMAPLDKEMANLLHENMVMNGVELILSDGVEEFIKNGSSTTIQLGSGRAVDADMVILSIGVRPNSKLVQDTDIKLNEKGGIIVDEYLQTSIPGIYAVGDAIQVKNFVTGEDTMIPLAGPANKQARIAADNICGDRKKYKGTMGTAVAKVFDLTAASVGVNEKQLDKQGKIKDRDYYVALINQKSHAGYYPGATPITLKMIFTPDGAILGAQIVGQEGVDKRIDVLATSIRMGADIYDLAELELSYAPPYSSAKDPVNMLGFVAENILTGLSEFADYREVEKIAGENPDESEAFILDITEDVERMVFAIPNSYHIPLGKLRERMDEIPRDKTIITYCAIGVRSHSAARALKLNGYDKVRILAGGTAFYKSMQYGERETVSVEHVKAEDDAREDATGERELKIIDCCGLQCPGPIMKVNEAIDSMQNSQVLKVSATDMGFAADIAAWCKKTGNTLIKKERVGGENIVYIRKGQECGVQQEEEQRGTPQGKTMVVFSGDLDKVLASFIIANGAAAMGRPVTMFFTFWGLNALRKNQSVPVEKSFIEKMFAIMMPRGSKKLKLSKMNMGGMGTAMMKGVMNKKNVDSLEMLMKHAMDSGVKLVACTMSMDIMGIKKEELIDGVEYAGVASYLGDAEDSNVNLFI